MSAPEFSEIQIGPAPPQRWRGALELVFRRSRPEAASRQVAQALVALDAIANRSAADASTAQDSSEEQTEHGYQPRAAVFAACRGDQLLGACWVQLMPGRTASFEPAQIAGDAIPRSDNPASVNSERIALMLTDAAVAMAAAGGARLIQTLLETDAGVDAQRLRRAGFLHVAELLYLVSDDRVFPSAAPTEELEFEPMGDATRCAGDEDPRDVCDPRRMNRLAAIVEQSYKGTLDCPQLDGVRPINEILAGYQAVGKFNSAHWLLVRHDARDIGCLLLAEYPERVWELVYMGLVPEARGHGWGLEITRHAQWLAGQRGAQRLVLAVDAKNGPAIDMYAASGLKAWDRRSAWLKIL